jgi:hypothetical protein
MNTSGEEENCERIGRTNQPMRSMLKDVLIIILLSRNENRWNASSSREIAVVFHIHSIRLLQEVHLLNCERVILIWFFMCFVNTVSRIRCSFRLNNSGVFFRATVFEMTNSDGLGKKHTDQSTEIVALLLMSLSLIRPLLANCRTKTRGVQYESSRCLVLYGLLAP